MLYELVKLTGAVLSTAEIEANAKVWMSGDFLGCWRTEIGPLGQLLILRSFRTKEDLERERNKALVDPNPFNGNGLVESMEMETFQCFPFLSEPTSIAPANIYEFRTYFLKPGRLQTTLDGWKRAVPKAAEYTDHLVINMYSLDGPPRIVHIWSFDSFEQRLDLRKRHYENGSWPPPGGPESILQANTIIALRNES